MQITSNEIEREDPEVILGSGSYRYRIRPFFAKIPAGLSMTKISSVAVDRHDNVYAFVRDGSTPVMIFDRSGNYLGGWGEDDFARPHGLHISAADEIYCTDDLKCVVRKYTLEGKPLLEIGIPGKPAPEYGPDPFNRCTHTALSPDGEIIYVSDGYGNARVHKFTQTGKLLASWGESGMDPGQFNIPHNICCDDDGWVYVVDRESHRVQVFDGNGRFEAEWRYLHRPCGLAVESASDGVGYVGELDPPLSNKRAPNLGPRVSVVAKDGTVLARLNNDPAAPPTHHLIVPHGVAVDSHGDIYVADTMKIWPRMFPGVPLTPGLGVLKKLVRTA